MATKKTRTLDTAAGPLALRKGQHRHTLTARSATGGTVTTEFRAGDVVPEGYRASIHADDLDKFDGVNPALTDGDPTTEPAA